MDILLNTTLTLPEAFVLFIILMAIFSVIENIVKKKRPKI